MDDYEVVAAIVAGDPAGLADAFDAYAASLYGCCRAFLSEPAPVSTPAPRDDADAIWRDAPDASRYHAADAVRDTFIIASARLEELRDPGQLGPWLHAVACNECHRQLHDRGVIPRTPWPGHATGPVTLPEELREDVLKACTDNAPVGRATRVSVAHRAGSFGQKGFPKAISRRGQVSNHRRVTVAAAAVLAVAAAATGIVAALAAGGPHHASAAAAGPSGAGNAVAQPGASSPPDQAISDPAGGSAGPSPSAASSVRPPVQEAAPAVTMQAASQPPSPSAATTTSTAPVVSQGTLLVSPAKLVLASTTGGPATGTILLTAQGGPVTYSITIPPGKAGEVAVAPSSGSIASGASVTVTVTATGTAALNVPVMVNPGGHTVIVMFSASG
jgi:DNA-directed RNA polymerase specialized sigma24 family protein